MLTILFILLLLILLFGGLGIYVAKVFFLAFALVLLASFLAGAFRWRRWP